MSKPAVFHRKSKPKVLPCARRLTIGVGDQPVEAADDRQDHHALVEEAADDRIIVERRSCGVIGARPSRLPCSCTQPLPDGWRPARAPDARVKRARPYGRAARSLADRRRVLDAAVLPERVQAARRGRSGEPVPTLRSKISA